MLYRNVIAKVKDPHVNSLTLTSHFEGFGVLADVSRRRFLGRAKVLQVIKGREAFCVQMTEMKKVWGG
jgi:hypothetical protein